MQPLGRLLGQVVLGTSRWGLQFPTGAGPGLRGLGKAQQPSICLRCRVRVLGAPASFSTSPRLLKDTEKPPTPEKHGESEYSSDAPENRDKHASSSLGGQLNDMKEKFSQVMDSLQSRALTAPQKLNHLTGYSGIDAIKAENDALEVSLTEAHDRVRAARQAYKSSNAKRATTQREVTTLLARKESWSPSDLERFTELYRTDHVLEGEVSAAQEALTEAEAEEQSLSQRLNAGILKRYHEEQIWSDRIRRASTWGTWGLMGMNFVLFVVLQFVAEPWKRRRLVKGVVEEEKAVLEDVRGELSAVKATLEARAPKSVTTGVTDSGLPVAASTAEPTANRTTSLPIWDATWKESILELTWWRMVIQDLYSERRLDLRMRDVSALALEGVAAGAAIAGSIAWVLARRS